MPTISQRDLDTLLRKLPIVLAMASQARAASTKEADACRLIKLTINKLAKNAHNARLRTN